MLRYTLLLLLLFSISLQAQQDFALEGTIKDFYGARYNLELANEGIDVIGNTYKMTVYEENELDYFKGNFTMDAEGFVRFFHYGTSSYVRFWVSPKGINGAKFEWENPKGTSSFYGVTKNENELLHRFDLEREEWLDDKVLPSRSLIEASEKRELKSLEVASNKGNVSVAFVTVMKQDIKYFWLSLAEEKGIVINKSLDQTDLVDANAWRTRYYFKYLYHYFSRKNRAFDLITKYENIQITLAGKKILEAYWAYDLLKESEATKVDFDVIKGYKLFRESFTNSPFVTQAAKNIALIEDEFKVINTSITSDMVIHEAYIPFQELLEQHKGQVIYVDIWATWCKPCIEEMRPRYKEPLKEFIKDKDIKIIYLSSDAESASERWKEKVRSLRLNAVNVRYPSLASSGVHEFLGLRNVKSFLIPRYFIIDKNGKLVNGEAPRPSDGELLYAELAKYL